VAARALDTDPNTLAELEGGDPFADLPHVADDFVAGDERETGSTPGIIELVNVRAADAAVGDLDVHLWR